jgi:hypothetical protein
MNFCSSKFLNISFYNSYIFFMLESDKIIFLYIKLIF